MGAIQLSHWCSLSRKCPLCAGHCSTRLSCVNGKTLKCFCFLCPIELASHLALHFDCLVHLILGQFLCLLWCFSFSNGHNQKVHMHMVDLMSSIVCEGDSVSQELLDTVLVNLVPAHKVTWISHIERERERQSSILFMCCTLSLAYNCMSIILY